MAMPTSPQKLQQLKMELVQLLSVHSTSRGLPLANLRPLYLQMFNKKLEYEDYGCDKLSDLLILLADVLKISRLNDTKGDLRVHLVPDSPFTLSSVTAPTSNFLAVPHNNDLRRSSTSSLTSVSSTTSSTTSLYGFKDALRRILGEHAASDGVLGSALKPLLRQYYDSSFDEKKFGYYKLVHMLRDCQDIIELERNETHNDVKVKLKRASTDMSISTLSEFSPPPTPGSDVFPVFEDADESKTMTSREREWFLRRILMEECAKRVAVYETKVRELEEENQSLREKLGELENDNRILHSENLRLELERSQERERFQEFERERLESIDKEIRLRKDSELNNGVLPFDRLTANHFVWLGQQPSPL
eukprot:GILK01003356.1.p1 GENE.GILK01003356.1~~GILK01003356.1.p1  ORF type:complete len:362 (+),score=55.73 GILK01003356.1:68-1153(+)